jgi:hypothetical protein
MARFITLTDAEPPRDAVAVNLDNVVWMRKVSGGTMIAFTVAPHYEQPHGELAAVTVSETLEEIKEVLQGIGDKHGQAWPL